MNYTSNEVCDILGVTFRQLHYWRDRGTLRPSARDAQGSGNLVLWSRRDLYLLKVLA